MDSLKMKRFLIDEILLTEWSGVGSKKLGSYCQDLRADIFPIHTEQTKNIYYMAKTIQI